MNPRATKLAERRDAIKAQLETYDNTVIERGTDLEGAEKANYDALNTELEKVVADHAEIVKRESLLADSFAIGMKLGVETKGGKNVAPAMPKKDDTELIYRSGGDHNPLADLLAAAQGNPDAAARIYQHNQANAGRVALHDRASTTTDLAGLVVPAYLTDEFAPVARELRPYLDSIRKRPLTAYTSVIGVQTVSTSAAVPSAQGVDYVVANPNAPSLTLTAQTIAGVAELTVEAVEFAVYDQGTLYQDITESYWRQSDLMAFHGSDSNGQVEGLFNSDGLNSTTATSATSGAAELYKKVVAASQQVHSNIFMRPTHVCMTSTRWYRILQDLDPNLRPLFGIRDSAGQNVVGDWVAGTFANLLVVIDDNIVAPGGTDTKAIVYRAQEHIALEQNGGLPSIIRVDQAKAAQGIVQFVGRGFMQYTCERRPKSTTIISALPVPTML